MGESSLRTKTITIFSYTHSMITLDANLEADLRKVMIGRGLATEEEALRAVVTEAAQAMDEETRRRRRQALDEAYGSWAGKGPDLPRKEDGSVDWGAWKDEMYEGMP